MSRIQVERPHALGREAVREKAEKLAQRLAREYDVRYQWRGDTLESGAGSCAPSPSSMPC